MIIPGAAANLLQTGTTTFSSKQKVPRRSLAHKRAPGDSARAANPRAVECAGTADGAAGGVLYLRMGDGRRSRLPRLDETPSAAGPRRRDAGRRGGPGHRQCGKANFFFVRK